MLERFDDGSYRSVFRDSSLDRRRSQGERPVRVVEYPLDGTSDAVYRLATTPLDLAAAPAAELAALYHERWEVERPPTTRSRPISCGPARSCRSKTPDLVRQEVHGSMLAHYAVRRLIHEAARKVDEDPDPLSFIHAERFVRRRVENLFSLGLTLRANVACPLNRDACLDPVVELLVTQPCSRTHRPSSRPQ